MWYRWKNNPFLYSPVWTNLMRFLFLSRKSTYFIFIVEINVFLFTSPIVNFRGFIYQYSFTIYGVPEFLYFSYEYANFFLEVHFSHMYIPLNYYHFYIQDVIEL